jgi:hypothetical protein
MTHADHSQSRPIQDTGSTARSQRIDRDQALEERYQRAKTRLLHAQDEKAEAIEELIAARDALHRSRAAHGH